MHQFQTSILKPKQKARGRHTAEYTKKSKKGGELVLLLARGRLVAGDALRITFPSRKPFLCVGSV